jgi:exodeoxyribonuclease VIII
MDGYKTLTGETPRGFVFICVEKKPPYAVGVYILDDHALKMGRIEYEEDLERYKKCKETGEWPSYADDDIATVTLPYWYYKQKDMYLYDV